MNTTLEAATRGLTEDADLFSVMRTSQTGGGVGGEGGQGDLDSAEQRRRWREARENAVTGQEVRGMWKRECGGMTGALGVGAPGCGCRMHVDNTQFVVTCTSHVPDIPKTDQP